MWGSPWLALGPSLTFYFPEQCFPLLCNSLTCHELFCQCFCSAWNNHLLLLSEVSQVSDPGATFSEKSLMAINHSVLQLSVYLTRLKGQGLILLIRSSAITSYQLLVCPSLAVVLPICYKSSRVSQLILLDLESESNPFACFSPTSLSQKFILSLSWNLYQILTIAI